MNNYTNYGGFKMRNKEVAVRHIEKLETCMERITYLLESWFGDKTERPINEALRYVKEAQRAQEYLNDIVGLEED